MQPDIVVLAVLFIEYMHVSKVFCVYAEKFSVSVVEVWFVLFAGRFIVVIGAAVSMLNVLSALAMFPSVSLA